MLVDSQKSAKCSTIDKTASQSKTESPEAECSTTEIQTKQDEEVRQATVQPSQTNKNSLNGEYDSTQPQASMYIGYRVGKELLFFRVLRLFPLSWVVFTLIYIIKS